MTRRRRRRVHRWLIYLRHRQEERKKKTVKKGFLERKPWALYPSGSEQGESQKEGTYSRFMSKCKVVDTTTMSKEEVDAATRQYAGTGNVSNPPQVRASV